jgi:hypothetical protein
MFAGQPVPDAPVGAPCPGAIGSGTEGFDGPPSALRCSYVPRRAAATTPSVTRSFGRARMGDLCEPSTGSEPLLGCPRTQTSNVTPRGCTHSDRTIVAQSGQRRMSETRSWVIMFVTDPSARPKTTQRRA